ncbi:hypothetical protein Hanom_Chr16g01423521 [Helianthus anomalus]
MAKMITRSSPGKSPEKDSTPLSQNLLMNPLSEICKFTDPEIESLSPCFPPEIVFRPFNSSVRSDAISPIWFCFLALPFLLGYSYHFPDLTRRFFTMAGISYGQAMPMLCRVLYTIEEIIKAEDPDFNFSELSHLYSLVTHGSHCFLFKAKPHHPLPILKTTQNDSAWKNQFFFVRLDYIPHGDSLSKK